MIISQLLGGLGNQMFQYAAGRALSLRSRATLCLDVSAFGSYRLHQGFELDRVFAGDMRIAAPADMRRVLGWRAAPAVRRVLIRPNLAWLRSSRFVVEPHFDYWPGLQNAPADSYLAGYWQSEKYFLEYEAEIRADFAFKPPLDARNAELASAITGENTISLHIRRGDYASNPKTLATHGLCSLEYYQAAIAYLAARVAPPVFYVFSDDIAWARENLHIEFPSHYIGHNQGAQSYVDMQLMSLCRHHIIANSSFSWWGAWLNPSREKTVVAPQNWFASGKTVDDLIPATWVRL